MVPGSDSDEHSHPGGHFGVVLSLMTLTVGDVMRLIVRLRLVRFVTPLRRCGLISWFRRGCSSAGGDGTDAVEPSLCFVSHRTVVQ